MQSLPSSRLASGGPIQALLASNPLHCRYYSVPARRHHIPKADRPHEQDLINKNLDEHKQVSAEQLSADIPNRCPPIGGHDASPKPTSGCIHQVCISQRFASSQAWQPSKGSTHARTATLGIPLGCECAGSSGGVQANQHQTTWRRRHLSMITSPWRSRRHTTIPIQPPAAACVGATGPPPAPAARRASSRPSSWPVWRCLWTAEPSPRPWWWPTPSTCGRSRTAAVGRTRSPTGSPWRDLRRRFPRPARAPGRVPRTHPRW